MSRQESGYQVSFYPIILIFFAIAFVAANAFAGETIKDNGSQLIEAVDDGTANVQASPPIGTMPVYRFYDTATGTHFYTMNEAEKNIIMSTLPQFQFEGVAFYAYPPPSPTPTPTPTPHVGTWSGTIVSFNVSSDGTSLTTTGSTLYINSVGYVSLKVVISGSNCQKVTVYYQGTIPINDGTFTRTSTWTDGSSLTVSGRFNSETSASGTYVYNGIGTECSGNGSWSTTY